MKLIRCAKSDYEFETPKTIGGLKTEGLDDNGTFLSPFVLSSPDTHISFAPFQIT